MAEKQLKVLLTSISAIKRDGVKRFFKEKQIPINLQSFNCDDVRLPPQPIDDSIERCGRERMYYILTQKQEKDYDTIISIESGVDTTKEDDICVVLLKSNGVTGVGKCSLNIIPRSYDPIEDQDRPNLHAYYQDLANCKKLVYESKYENHEITGYDTTLGELIQRKNPSVNSKNWMKDMMQIDRVYQIYLAILDAFYDQQNKEKIRAAYKTYPDYPKKGVLFQDFSPVLADKLLLKLLVKQIADIYKNKKIDYVVGLESRGYLLAPPVAIELGAGLIRAAKPGKLPGPIFERSYGKEYGPDILQIQQDSMKPGSNVLVIDDLIATGGSLNAACRIVIEDLKCNVVECFVMTDVPALREDARKNLNGIHCTVLLR